VGNDAADGGVWSEMATRSVGKLEGCSTRRKVRTDSQLPRGLPELAFIFSVRALIFARRGQAGGVYKCTDTLWRGQCWWTLPNNWGCMDLQSSRGGNVRLSAIGPDAGGFVSIPDLRKSLHGDLAF